MRNETRLHVDLCILFRYDLLENIVMISNNDLSMTVVDIDVPRKRTRVRL